MACRGLSANEIDRALISMVARSNTPLQSEAGYIDARPKTRSTKLLATHGRTIQLGQGLPVRLVDHSVSSTPSTRKSSLDQSLTVECHSFGLMQRNKMLRQLAVQRPAATICAAIQSPHQRVPGVSAGSWPQALPSQPDDPLNQALSSIKSTATHTTGRSSTLRAFAAASATADGTTSATLPLSTNCVAAQMTWTTAA